LTAEVAKKAADNAEKGRMASFLCFLRVFLGGLCGRKLSGTSKPVTSVILKEHNRQFKLLERLRLHE
jgi:hypothetical protein